MSDSQTKTVVIDLPERLTREVKARAAREGITLKQLYREALENRIREQSDATAVA